LENFFSIEGERTGAIDSAAVIVVVIVIVLDGGSRDMQNTSKKLRH
jgi:hypothetical protein